MINEDLIKHPTLTRKALAIAILFLAGVGFGTLVTKLVQFLV